MEETMKFEQGMDRLEEIVRRLEKGDVALEDSLKLFEEGTAILRTCTARLDEAEQQVVRLKKGPDGAPQELPFEVEE